VVSGRWVEETYGGVQLGSAACVGHDPSGVGGGVGLFLGFDFLGFLRGFLREEGIKVPAVGVGVNCARYSAVGLWLTVLIDFLFGYHSLKLSDHLLRSHPGKGHHLYSRVGVTIRPDT